MTNAELTTQELEAIRKRAEQAKVNPFQLGEISVAKRYPYDDIPKLLAEVDRLNDKIGFYLDEFERRQKLYDDLARKQAINGGD